MTDATSKARAKMCWADVEVDEDDLPMALKQQVQQLSEASHSSKGSRAGGKLPSASDRLLRLGWLPSIDEGFEEDDDNELDTASEVSSQDSLVRCETSSASTDVPDDSDEEPRWSDFAPCRASKVQCKKVRNTNKAQSFVQPLATRARYVAGR
mmetsp:Transcript_83990/g.218680  ORF Transcript_83990/g.218680 Transcript_83990/m.218680 type:complete len:153 (-) Transcript_83990:136-594(-)